MYQFNVPPPESEKRRILRAIHKIDKTCLISTILNLNQVLMQAIVQKLCLQIWSKGQHGLMQFHHSLFFF